ncbi:hypothetical protein ASPVEDRAFT_44785 [Aspergillus versicolor CBS 583.65]|uniref:Uncharacterized protein n=1 Tax=Aspergillus versicolor CBS 583.65 TaxID=1036611 RepID=A0A1L9PUX8_ASPVE|nr:uncharacterized protein ASPVEDRAFT_44785 [Aspergillus versicolor CBS 583.65]OJJ05273.1 hypothetical protein ASPVEDRAFT_44785 [Aspergillus versicolor CBS 583.65]
MDPIFPANTPEGFAYTPAFVLQPGTRIKPLGLISPKRDGTVRSSIADQTRDCLLNLSDALSEHGPSARAVKLVRFMTDVREIWSSQPEFDQHFGSDLPTSTLIEVPVCSEFGFRVELDVWAAVPDSHERRSKSPGFLGFANASAGLAAGKGAAAEFNAAIDAITNRVSAVGGSGRVVKLEVYLSDMRVWPICQDVVRSRYPTRPPVVVPISAPKVLEEGSCINVEATFELPSVTEGTSDISRVTFDKRIVAISGQPAIPVFVGGKARDTYKHRPEASAAEQTVVALRNLEHILAAAGSDWDNVFKTTWYVMDLREWPEIQQAAYAVMGQPPPSPTVLEVSKLVAPAVRVEPDIWAVVKSDS